LSGVTLFRAWGAAATLISCSSVAPLAPPPVIFKGPATSPIVASASPLAPASAPLLTASPAPTLPPAVSAGDIGVSGAVTLLAASTSGSWVALCQGQPATASLVLGSGTGEAIDAVLAQEASGRYLVVLQQGVARLVDAIAGTRVDLSALGADVRRAKQDYGGHRALSFDGAGQHLAYLRKQGSQVQIVVRDLESGGEQTFAAGAGEIFQLRLSVDARYVTYEAIRDDTTHNGKLDWPVPEESSESRACGKASAPPKLRSYTYLGRGDATLRAVVSLADGKARDLPELVTPLGSRLLVRETDGSLRLDLGGKRSPFAPASCAGRVLFADAAREQALVTCALPKKPGKREVWLFASGYAKNLQSELYETSTDREAVLGARLVPLYPGSDARLVDLERRDVLALAAGSRVIQTSGSTALLWRGNELFSYDAEHQKEQRLAQGVAKNPDLLRAGSAALLSPFVVLDAAAPALQSPTSEPLALSSSGHVLTGQQPAGAGATAAPAASIQGPLHWLDARLPPPDGPPR
jgi:hypothetical protein